MKNKLKSKNLKSAVLFLVDKNIKLGAFVIFLSMLGKTLMLFNRSESLLDEILKIAINISIVLIIVLLICISYLAILNLSKLPFNKEELTKHKITTPDEYLEFINGYLRPLTNYESFILDEQRRNKIIITSYLNLYDKDEEKKKHFKMSFHLIKKQYVITIMILYMISIMKLLLIMKKILISWLINFSTKNYTTNFCSRRSTTKRK